MGMHPSSFPFTIVPLHEKAQELVELVSMPELLETRSLAEIHRIMARCRYRLEESGGVTIGWGATRTGAFLVTTDHSGICLCIGPSGTYGVDVSVQDILHPTQREI